MNISVRNMNLAFKKSNQMISGWRRPGACWVLASHGLCFFNWFMNELRSRWILGVKAST